MNQLVHCFTCAAIKGMAVTLLIGSLWGVPVYGGTFSPYPNSVLDRDMSAKSTQALRDGGSRDEVRVYTSQDSFENVAAYYKKIGKEYAAPWTKIAQTLPDGRDIKIKVFLLDNAEDVGDSKQWVQVQYPFIGEVETVGSAPRYKDVRNVTSIVYTQLK